MNSITNKRCIRPELLLIVGRFATRGWTKPVGLGINNMDFTFCKVLEETTRSWATLRGTNVKYRLLDVKQHEKSH